VLRLTLKSVRGHLGRFLLTLFAVALGIAFLAGSFVLTDGLSKTFDDLIQAAAKGTDVAVRGVNHNNNVTGRGVSTRLPLTLEPTRARVDGVSRVSPDIQGSILLVGKNGTPVRTGGGGAPTLGFAYHPDDPAVKLVHGQAPHGPNEVAVVTSTLTQSGLKIGDTTRALVGHDPRSVKIVGEVSFDGPLAGATLTVLDRASALAAFSPDGTVPSFSLAAAKGVSPDQLRKNVAPVLPKGAEAVTAATLGKEIRDQIGTVLSFVNIILVAFAGVSLFVGGFIIWNTFSMLVAQRSRELALLRAVGASRAQVQRAVLGESVVVGLAGSVVGLLLGIGLANGLQPVLGAIGISSTGQLPVKVRTVVVALVVGTIVTAVAALVPAIRASRIAPVEAMRDDVAVTPKGVRGRGLVGGLMVVAGVVMIVAGVVPSSTVWPLIGIGALVTLVGAIVASPVATRPVVRVVAWPFVALMGTVGSLARENSLRNPRRTAATASALMIGLTLIAGMSVIAQSIKSSVSDLVATKLSADFVLNGGGAAPFPAVVGDKVRELAGVASVAGLGGVPVDVAGNTTFAVATDTQGLADNVVVDLRSGRLTALDDGQVLVNASTAKARGWRVGSPIRAAVGNLPAQQLTVGGIFADNQMVGGSMVVPRALYAMAVPVTEQGDYLVYVKAAKGRSLPALRTALVDIVKPFIVVSVQDGTQFTNSQAQQVNQLLGIIYVLLALSVVIAILGIINTLALSVLERTREIGLLRAVGLTKRQLFRVISIESVSTAVFGALLGAALGLGLGVALQRGLRAQGVQTLSIPWLQLLVMIVAAAVVGLLAAILPAWRATRLDVLQAVTTE